MRNHRIMVGIVLLVVFQFAIGGGIPLPPIVNPKPINLPGFNVLVVLEESETGDDVISDSVRVYLESECDEFYIWDDSHTDFKYVADEWRKAYETAKTEATELPWITISGKGGTSEKLPASDQATLELLKRYEP